MPIYEFECLTCGEQFEKHVTLSEYTDHKETIICPKCHGYDHQQLMTAPGRIVFRGPGFYETDYKMKEKK